MIFGQGLMMTRSCAGLVTFFGLSGFFSAATSAMAPLLYVLRTGTGAEDTMRPRA
jgi:hypothetical protein